VTLDRSPSEAHRVHACSTKSERLQMAHRDSNNSNFEIAEGPIYPLGPDIVKFEAQAIGNNFSSEFPLRINVTFGDTEFEHEYRTLLKATRRNYRISVKHCKLIYSLDGCEISEETKHRQPIQTGSLSDQSSVKISSERDGEASLHLSIDPSVIATGILSKMFGLAASAKVQAKRGKNQTITYKSQIDLIEPIPNGWTIGIEGIGDPYRANTNYCLRSIYFDEINIKHGSSCIVSFQPDAEEAKLNFGVYARGGLFVQRVDDEGRSQGEVTGQERSSLIEEMRCRIAGIILEKSLPAGAVLARCKFVARRGSSQDPDDNAVQPKVAGARKPRGKAGK
jgi:hypothetical protein